MEPAVASIGGDEGPPPKEQMGDSTPPAEPAASSSPTDDEGGDSANASPLGSSSVLRDREEAQPKSQQTSPQARAPPLAAKEEPRSDKDEFRGEPEKSASAQRDERTGDDAASPDAGRPPRRTMFEEAEDCLANGILMFLYADLRLLSATGRINTRFETLRVESDHARRTTADEIGLSPKQIEEGFGSWDAGGGERGEGGGGPPVEGISPAQIMAVLIVELRREVLLQRKRAKERVEKEREWGGRSAADSGEGGQRNKEVDDDEGPILATLNHKAGRKQLEEDGMNEMLKAYNDMIGKDLKRELPVVKPSALGAWKPPTIEEVKNKVGEARSRLRHRMSMAGGMGMGLSTRNFASTERSAATSASVTAAMATSVRADKSAAAAAVAIDGGAGTADAAAPPSSNSAAAKAAAGDGSSTPASGGEEVKKDVGVEVAIPESDSMEELGNKEDPPKKSFRSFRGMSLNLGSGNATNASSGVTDDGAPHLEHHQSAVWGRIAQKRQEMASDFDAYMQETREKRAFRKNIREDVHEYALADETATAFTEIGDVGDMLFGMSSSVRRRDSSLTKALLNYDGDGRVGHNVGVSEMREGGGDAVGKAERQDSLRLSGLAKISEVSSSREQFGDYSHHSYHLNKNGATSEQVGNENEVSDDQDKEEELPTQHGMRSPLRGSQNSLVWDPSGNSSEDEEEKEEPDAADNAPPSSGGAVAVVSPDNIDATSAPMDSSRSRRQSVSATSRALTETELLDHMSRCIESRDYGKLDFMRGFFREGTLSRVMIRSKSRVVWLNDWYPVQDCIYAISVDVEKRRALVVFRGAITEADWSHSFDSKLKKVPNPIQEPYEKRTDYVKVYRGFYTYLFRQRKDTGTRKWDEIAALVHKYGMSRIGPDYELVVNGFSLGAALSTLFGFYASNDKRFTRNGPVRIFTFGSPYVLSHSFAAAYQHQEKMGRLQHARIYNTRDFVTHLPPNMHPYKGSRFRHVGVSVKLKGTLFGHRAPEIFYVPREGSWSSYWRAVRNNCIIQMPLPWKIKKVHGLAEHLRRLSVAREVCKGSSDPLMHKSLDEIYELLVLNKDDMEATS